MTAKFKLLKMPRLNNFAQTVHKFILETKRQTQVVSEEKDFKRKVASIVSLCTIPIIYASNLLVYALIKKKWIINLLKIKAKKSQWSLS